MKRQTPVAAVAPGVYLLKQWGIEHRQPHSSPFVCLFSYLPRLASASSRHLRKTPKQKSWLWGATQFSGSRFLARQGKARREYPLVLSRVFPQYWRKAAPANLSGFGSPLLKLTGHFCPVTAHFTGKNQNLYLPVLETAFFRSTKGRKATLPMVEWQNSHFFGFTTVANSRQDHKNRLNAQDLQQTAGTETSTST